MNVVNNKFFDTIQDLIEKIEDQNSKLRFTYSKALKAIKSYPLLLRNGTEAKKEVNGVGEKIAGILNNLKCKGDGSPYDPETTTQSKPSQNFDKPNDGSTIIPKKRSARQKEYIPSAKSGGYAILLTLFRHSEPTGFLNKQDIIRLGEQYCNSSFTMPKAGSSLHHTAWTSMTKLIKEDLVMEAGNPKRYSLTDAGMELATKLSEAHDKKISKHEVAKKDVLLDSYCTSDMIDVDDNQPIPHESNIFNRLSNQPSTSTAPSLIRSRPWQENTYRQFCNNPAPRFQQPISLEVKQLLQKPDNNARNLPNGSLNLKNSSFFQEKEIREMEKIDCTLQGYSGTLRKIPFGSYEIILALDNREIRSRKDRDFFQLELEKRGVKVITIPLTLGDVCWVARSIYNHEDMTILDYIIERKGKDDLISSIMDGRFREQKHRLKKCGLPNIIYLVEEYDPFSWGGDALATALTETQILQGFFVKQCSNASETVEYLVNLTNSICSQHLNTPLCVMNSVDIQSDSFARLKQALSKKYKRPFYIPLSSFFTLTTKTKQLTQLDIWTKQLLTIRGVSSEKAILLVKKFKCLKDLIEKLSPLNEEERIQMIMDCGVSSHQRRQFGRALAKNIVATLFGDDH